MQTLTNNKLLKKLNDIDSDTSPYDLYPVFSAGLSEAPADCMGT